MLEAVDINAVKIVDLERAVVVCRGASVQCVSSNAAGDGAVELGITVNGSSSVLLLCHFVHVT